MSISCSNCGFAFEKEDHTKPCPKCSSHNLSITLVEKIRCHDLSKLGKKEPSSPKRRHKFDQEIVTGEKVGEDGKAISIGRIVDREQDVYRQTVQDEHGQIKVKKHEKLSEHR